MMDFIFRILNCYLLMSNDGKQYSKKVHDFDLTNLATAMKTCSFVSFDTTHDADFVAVGHNYCSPDLLAESQSAIYVPASRSIRTWG